MSEQANDPMAEVNAMGAVAAALKDLDAEGIGRVLQWAAGRFGASFSAGQRGNAPPIRADQADPGVSGAPEFASLADLYAAAQPKTDADRALVAAYWVQYSEGGQADFPAQSVNTALKHLGHGVSNITMALDTLKAQTPALVMQVRKAGTSKQARKKYKLTAAGKKFLEDLVGQ